MENERRLDILTMRLEIPRGWLIQPALPAAIGATDGAWIRLPHKGRRRVDG